MKVSDLTLEAGRGTRASPRQARIGASAAAGLTGMTTEMTGGTSRKVGRLSEVEIAVIGHPHLHALVARYQTGE
jgi:hypothetical protein